MTRSLFNSSKHVIARLVLRDVGWEVSGPEAGHIFTAVQKKLCFLWSASNAIREEHKREELLVYKQ